MGFRGSIDDAITSPDLFHHINSFSVDICDGCLSDVHLLLSLELYRKLQVEVNFSTNPLNGNETEQHKEETSKLRVKWDRSKLLQFRGAFEIDSIQY